MESPRELSDIIIFLNRALKENTRKFADFKLRNI